MREHALGDVVGIDARGRFALKGKPSDEAVAQLNAAFWMCFHPHDMGMEWKHKLFANEEEQDPKPNIFELRPGTTDVYINFDLDRYYGPDYARGPAMKHITILGWLIRNPLVKTVYYGGDCTDDEDHSEWTPQCEARWLNHWLAGGHSSYWRY